MRKYSATRKMPFANIRDEESFPENYKTVVHPIYFAFLYLYTLWDEQFENRYAFILLA